MEPVKEKRVLSIWGDLIGPTCQTAVIICLAYFLFSLARLFDRL
jgi:hypothetical protein